MNKDENTIRENEIIKMNESIENQEGYITQNLFHKKSFKIALASIVVLMVIVCAFWRNDITGERIVENDLEVSNALNLNEGLVLEQAVYAEGDITNITVAVATYNESCIEGIVQLAVLDGNSGEILGITEYDTYTIVDGQDIMLSFESPLDTKDKDLILQFTAQYADDRSIALWANDEGEVIQQYVIMDTEQLIANYMKVVVYTILTILLIAFAVLKTYKYRKKMEFRGLYLLGEIVLAASSLIIVQIIRTYDIWIYNEYLQIASVFLGMNLIIFLLISLKKDEKNIEKVYLITSIGLGTIMCLSFPVLRGLDEHIHYGGVVRMADASYPEIESTDVALAYGFDIWEIPDETRYDYLNETSKASEEIYTTGLGGVNLYQMIGYLPLALGWFIGNTLGLMSGNIFLFGKIFNVLFCSYIVYLSIKKLKSGKLIAAATALLPMNLYLMSTYTYDTWLTVFILYGVCSVISELQQPDKYITVREQIIMVASFSIGILIKPTYFPILILLLLIKKDKYKSKNQYKVYMVVLIAILVCMIIPIVYMVLRYFQVSGGGDIRGGSDVNASLQIKYILYNPVQYGLLLLSYAREYIGEETVRTLMQNYGYIGDSNGTALWYILYVGIVLTDRMGIDYKVLGIKNRVILILASLGALIVSMTALYVAFTPVGYETINGFQERYIIPVLFSLVYAIGIPFVKNTAKYNTYCIAGIILICLLNLSGIVCVLI